MCGCGKCDGVMRYDQVKKIMLFKDGCDWLPVPASAIGSAGSGGADEWDGQAPIPDADEVPHDNPLYTTMDSMRCAKATALVNEIWNVLAVYEGIDEVSTFAMALEVIAGIFAPAIVSVQVVTNLLLMLSRYGEDVVLPELEGIWEDTELKNNLICLLTDQMEAPKRLGSFELFGQPILLNALTATDVKSAVDAFEAATPDKDIAHNWIGLFPISSWLEIVTPKIPSTDCGCETYAPPPVIPEGSGTLLVSVVKHWGFDSSPAYPDNPDSLFLQTPLSGNKIDGQTYETVDLPASDDGLGLLVSVPTGVKIVRVLATGQYTGSTTNLVWSNGFYESVSNNGSFTVAFEADGRDPAIISAPSDFYIDALANAQYLYIAYTIYGSGVGAAKITLSNLRFNIAAVDGSWTRNNVIDGDIFTL